MNIYTDSMNRLTKMLLNTDSKLKKMGATPYGITKITPKEQRLRYESLTPEKLFELIEKEGLENVNAWLSKHEEKT